MSQDILIFYLPFFCADFYTYILAKQLTLYLKTLSILHLLILEAFLFVIHPICMYEPSTRSPQPECPSQERLQEVEVGALVRVRP